MQIFYINKGTPSRSGRSKEVFKQGIILTGFLQVVKNSGSEIGSLKYERMMLARSPLGGSLVILTPFCRTETGKLGLG